MKINYSINLLLFKGTRWLEFKSYPCHKSGQQRLYKCSILGTTMNILTSIVTSNSSNTF